MAPSLYERATSLESLERAWDEIQDRGDNEDEPSVAISRFAERAEERLERMAAELSTSEYRPGFLFPVEIPKRNGGVRVLHVPSVRDRILERAVLDRVAPWVDPHLGPASFGFRPGLGVVDAVQVVVAAREAGRTWVLRTDVADCFPTIPRVQALTKLWPLLPDNSLNGLIEALVNRRAASGFGGAKTTTGLPQGASLSPLLTNLVLVELDEALSEQGFHPVRFADDIAIPCRTEGEAQDAREAATSALKGLGMALSADKTQIMSFDDGFCFLGEDFGPRYPPVVAEHRVEEPTQRVIYVGLQGSRMYTAKGRLIVETKDDEEVLDVPSSHVTRIVCFGSVGIASGARSWMLASEVDTVFLSRRGTYLGQHLAASAPSRVARLRAQLDVADDPAAALPFAWEVIGSKIRHQITVLRKLTSPDVAEDVGKAIEQMRNAAAMLPDSRTADEVMGLEGIAAKAYFETLGYLVPEELRFAVRSRRPPMDVVNAALGYGYAILLSECVSALVASGLDPAIGMIHADQDNRPSLALDLMEEFRPYVVDLVVMRSALRGGITAGSGIRTDGVPGVLLSKAGKETLVDGYEKRMLTITSGALPNFAGSIRRHVYRQAQRVAAYVADPGTGWRGMSWR